MNNLLNFTAKFFENLKAKLTWDGEVLTVENVPESFEKKYKKSPYYLVFDKNHLTEKRTLMNQGEEIFNIITQYLKKKSTTILKIKFDTNPEKILTNNLFFKNCSPTNIKTTSENNSFYRFMFQTNFTYLNKKEQVINEIYVHNGKVVKGDLKGYQVEEGKKQEISTKNIEKNYEIAKNKIKELIKERTQKISGNLNKHLTKGIGRIEKYYKTQTNEAEEKIKKEQQKINQLQQKNTPEKNEETIEKINKSKETIEKIRQEVNSEKINKEKNNAINDEKHKHSLNIDNNLINTTVIYYPQYTYTITFDKNPKKTLKINYNPLLKELSEIKCDVCKKTIKQINTCANGHVTCDDHYLKCANCGGYYCTNCLKDNCQICHSKICKNCQTTCRKCHKTIGKKHLTKDEITGNSGCTNCLKTCPQCHKTSDPKTFTKNKKGTYLCKTCSAKEKGNNLIKDIFR